MVQIENSILARPLAGVQQANIVYEYLAEGGITRMTVIYFAPSGSQRIEPVRSARPVTLRLWHAYHGVLFFSGANIKVLQAIQDQHVPALTEGSDGGAYFARDPSRRAPHNLYADGNRLAQGVSTYAPRVTYVLPSPGEPAASPAPPVANRIVFDQTSSHRVIYTYSATDNAYTYSTVLGALVDQDTGQAIKPVNVILRPPSISTCRGRVPPMSSPGATTTRPPGTSRTRSCPSRSSAPMAKWCPFPLD